RHQPPEGRVALRARGAGPARARAATRAGQLPPAEGGGRRAHRARSSAGGTPACGGRTGAALDRRHRRRKRGAARPRDATRGAEMTRLLRCAGALLLALLSSAAQAHKPSDSYLTITQTDAGFEGRWDIALRDLDFALGLDANGDGAITWGEVRAKHAAIAAYAGARLRL